MLRSLVLIVLPLGTVCAITSAQQKDAVQLHGPVAACGGEHRAFDYIIGKWRIVETDSGRFFAENRAERIHDGCGVRESLRMRDGTLGTSTNFFHPTEKLWHTFYHGSDGFHAHLTGLVSADGTQELTADVRLLPEKGRVRKARQVTSKDSAGRPRQVGYVMKDDLSWQVIYDLTFCPADEPSGKRTPPC